MTPRQESLVHYDAAVRVFNELRAVLADARALALLEALRQEVEEAFWLSRLGLRITPRVIEQTLHCRSILLTRAQVQHLDQLKRGMVEADCSLAPGGLSAPWNALFSARERVHGGNARRSFEAGFVIRLFLLLQEACAEPGAPDAARRWLAGQEHGPRKVVLRY